MKYRDYVDLKFRPSNKDLICEFYVEAENIKKAAGGVAAESSIGTWTEVATATKKIEKLAAKVFFLEELSKKAARIKISYPPELFEQGNMPQVLSSIAGNIFGMKDVINLRLNDIAFPKSIAKSFLGPKYGIEGIRKIFHVKRPLIGTIIKPKLGLNTKDHARVAYEAWLGGCNILKDDENLSNQKFNKFEARLKETLRMRDKAEAETGEKKAYMINVTAETEKMLRRAKLAEKYGNEYVMVDVMTVGWSALQTLRNANLDLVLHAHRAGHAALTKNKKHGISMRVIARICRLIGFDQLHIGTALGKMFETKEDVIENRKVLLDDFYGLKKVMPVASGGLHPLMIPELLKIFGNDVVLQFGGGIHGNKLGTRLGAVAARQALDATIKGISLEEYAKTHAELKSTLDQWRAE